MDWVVGCRGKMVEERKKMAKTSAMDAQGDVIVGSSWPGWGLKDDMGVCGR